MTTVGGISHHQRKLVYLHLGHRQQPSYGHEPWLLHQPTI